MILFMFALHVLESHCDSLTGPHTSPHITCPPTGKPNGNIPGCEIWAKLSTNIPGWERWERPEWKSKTDDKNTCNTAICYRLGRACFKIHSLGADQRITRGIHYNIILQHSTSLRGHESSQPHVQQPLCPPCPLCLLVSGIIIHLITSQHKRQQLLVCPGDQWPPSTPPPNK